MADGLGIMRRQDPTSYFSAILIDDDAMSINDIDLRMCCKVATDERESSGQEQIVRIQIGHDFSLRVPESLDNCIGLSAVGFTHAVRQIPLEFGQNFFRFIAGSAIDNSVLETWIILTYNTSDRLV